MTARPARPARPIRPARSARDPRDARRPRRGRADLPHGLRIVHEDAELIVVDKPAGLLTANVPGERRESVFDALKALARERAGRNARVYIVHRLDKDASGLLVFAKTEKAFHWLKEDFRSRRVHRLYLAVVEGEVPAPDGKTPSGTIQTYMIDEDDEGLARSVPIGEVAKEGRNMRARAPRHPAPRRPGPLGRDEPRLAVTHYRVLGAGMGRSLVQLRLETGRKNQIRVHMKEWGHPIIGDQRYGAATDPLRRVALHAVELGFGHPGTGMTGRHHSPAPEAFFRSVGMDPPASPVRPPEGAPAPGPVHASVAATSWDSVAPWYDDLIGERRSDLYEQVIAPGVLRLLSPVPGIRVLDVACGQGDLCRRLAGLGVDAVGVDASPRLIDAARSRTDQTGVRFEVGDARSLEEPALGLVPSSFDAATCVMALMNINPLEPVLRGVAALLKPGGTFTAVILHPAFRAPGQTSWGWDRTAEPDRAHDRARPRARPAGTPRQFRRVEGYLSPGQSPIVMNPGGAAHGADPVTTTTFHRPIQSYAKALTDAGLLIAALEEWTSPRVSQPGPRAAEENRARAEIPMFLALRAVRPPAS